MVDLDYVKKKKKKPLQVDLRNLRMQILHLTISQMWKGGTNRSVMEQVLLQIKVEINIMVL